MIKCNIAPDRVFEGAEECMFGDNGMVGFCLSCDEEVRAEPDAEKMTCESCGEKNVYGAETLLAMGFAE
jgi:predicted RNA-binding Zn-ribbon protein involved in translation (DUF1610 family)